ncbi:MAG: GNAT family N-acetyltransferase [Spirochaetia bacterium]|nr:GNAT family N-acetyltransferase [Spirochaetia bacterium]
MQIVYLNECRNHIPDMAARFHSEWGRYHPTRKLSDVIHLLTERAEHTDRLDLSLVAIGTSTWMGSASLKQYDMETVRDLSPWLSSVYVKPEFRNQGIARALIEQIVTRANDLGFKPLYLCTVDAENYYERLGWTRKRIARENGIDFVIMEKA